GIPETQSAARPVAAAEMVLIRLAHASTMPTLDEALKKLDGAPPASAPQPNQKASSNTAGSPQGQSSAVSSAAVSSQNAAQEPVAVNSTAPMRMIADNPQPNIQPEVKAPEVPVTSLEDMEALADKHRDPLTKVNIRKCVRLVSIAPGSLSVTLTEDAPNTLVGDLSRKLSEWTGTRWMVMVSRDETGGPTLEEIADGKRNAMLADASRDPDVAGILAVFPGAKIIDVRLGGDQFDTDIEISDEYGAANEVPIDPDDENEF
ncbi:MAG: DNA polymerase III subunit gamma/tau, partial [Pseudomonadota bacterium]